MSFGERLSGLDFRMDPETGQIMGVKQEAAEEAIAAPTPIETVPEKKSEPAVTPQAPADPRDERIAKLEAQIEVLTKQGGQQPAPQPQEQPVIELPEGGNLTPDDYNFLVDVFKSMVGQALQPIEPVLADYAVQRQVQDVLATLENENPGEGMAKWNAVLPQIRKVVENAPELSITQAFEIVRAGTPEQPTQPVEAPAPTEAQSDSGEANDTSVDATQAKLAEARAKAAKLQTEEGVGGDAAPDEGPPKTVRDALNAAITEVYG